MGFWNAIIRNNDGSWDTITLCGECLNRLEHAIEDAEPITGTQECYVCQFRRIIEPHLRHKTKVTYVTASRPYDDDV
jgi:hypothetical protein